jgi:hypothetical protein
VVQSLLPIYLPYSFTQFTMLSQLILSFLFTALVNAQDPSTPCISGACTHQAGDGLSTAYSFLTIASWNCTPTCASDLPRRIPKVTPRSLTSQELQGGISLNATRPPLGPRIFALSVLINRRAVIISSKAERSTLSFAFLIV